MFDLAAGVNGDNVLSCVKVFLFLQALCLIDVNYIGSYLELYILIISSHQRS